MTFQSENNNEHFHVCSKHFIHTVNSASKKTPILTHFIENTYNMDNLHDILTESGCEIHSVKEGPGGDKKYEKASKKQFVDTANQVNEVSKVTEELKDYTFDQRFEWVDKHKKEGNEFYKNEQYGQALDKYLHALYGMHFKDQTIEMEQKVNHKLKVPLLNNMAVCLLKVKEYTKVVAMTDQVLMIDSKNVKALFRRTQALIELSNLVDAKDSIDKLTNLVTSAEELKTLDNLKSTYKLKYEKEKEFAKNAFGNTSSGTKAPVTPSLVDKDEVEYLRTIGFVHWMLYPAIKALRGILN